jgi:hypothetical protein
MTEYRLKEAKVPLDRDEFDALSNAPIMRPSLFPPWEYHRMVCPHWISGTHAPKTPVDHCLVG